MTAFPAPPAPLVSAPVPAAAPDSGRTVTVSEAAARAAGLVSYADAVAIAAPAVVNVYTTKEVQRRGQSVDPLYRYFFGDSRGGPERVASLGSGVVATAEAE